MYKSISKIAKIFVDQDAMRSLDNPVLVDILQSVFFNIATSTDNEHTTALGRIACKS